MPGTPFVQPKPTCDCCRREVDRLRHSMWHGQAYLCSECFQQWYDPDNGTFDTCDPIQLGNYVRSKHGLPPLGALTSCYETVEQIQYQRQLRTRRETAGDRNER